MPNICMIYIYIYIYTYIYIYIYIMRASEWVCACEGALQGSRAACDDAHRPVVYVIGMSCAVLVMSCVWFLCHVMCRVCWRVMSCVVCGVGV